MRWLPVWLLSVILAFGLQMAQVGDAGPAGEDPSRDWFAVAEAAGSQPARSPICHIGITCAEAAAEDGPDTGLSVVVAVVARPDGMQSQRRFGGPSVALPPPRT